MSYPAARAAANAARTLSGECSRSSDASTAMSNDWAPIDRRSYPAPRSARREASSTVSGFASVVISASAATSKVSRRWTRSDARSSGVCIVGVPPPRNTLVDLRAVPRGDGERRLGHQRSQVARCQVVQAGVGVEVAVAAPGETERDVDVDADRFLGALVAVGHFFVSRLLPSSTRSAAMNASCGTSTRPTRRMRALPFFCCSSSLRLRLMSPP